MLSFLDQITVDVQLTSEFFDPNKYLEHEELPLRIDYHHGSLNSLFA